MDYNWYCKAKNHDNNHSDLTIGLLGNRDFSVNLCMTFLELGLFKGQRTLFTQYLGLSLTLSHRGLTIQHQQRQGSLQNCITEKLYNVCLTFLSV